MGRQVIAMTTETRVSVLEVGHRLLIDQQAEIKYRSIRHA